MKIGSLYNLFTMIGGRNVVQSTLIVMLTALLASVSQAEDQHPGERSVGQTIYVPAYSHVFTHEQKRQPLASTLLVHNVDPVVPIVVTRVRYHNEAGEVVRDLLDAPVDLAPFQSGDFLVPINDDTGGVGANFVVEWTSDQPALGPLTESVMIGGTGTHGISFTARGKVIAVRPGP